jgi:hypothetical protein
MPSHHKHFLFATAALTLGLWQLALTSSCTAWTVGSPIVTYWNWGAYSHLTEARAQEAAAGGYNLVWIDGLDQLAIAQKYGLRAMWFNYNAAPTDAEIDAFKKSPAAYCYFISDEPNAGSFSQLGATVNHIRQRDPDHFSYINLFPNYASNSTLGANGYSAYLSQFISTVGPSMLSYDNYPFLKTGDRKGYLQNLATMSAAATQARLPFMNVVQADGNSTPIGTKYRVPNANELRFQVYTTMAYGAQGISYFCYYHDDPNTPTGGGLMPDLGNAPTATYQALTPLNREFKNIVAQYQSLRLIGDYLKGYSPTGGPPGTTTLPNGSPFDIGSVSNNMQYHDGDALKGVLFGFFDKDSSALADASVALVVNLDDASSKTYTLNGPGDLSIFDATTGRWAPTGQNYAVLNLAPGGGALVGLTSAVPEPSSIILLIFGAMFLMLRAWRKKEAV